MQDIASPAPAASPRAPSDRAEPAEGVAGGPIEDTRIELVEEQLHVGKRERTTGTIRVQTRVAEEHVLLSDTLRQQRIEVERVAMNRPIETAPDIRDEGDTVVIPVVEERLVVEKRLFLVEEVRLRRVASDARIEIPATRRVMHADVVRSSSPAESHAGSAPTPSNKGDTYGQ